MSEEMWQVVVRVPMRIGDGQRDALFNRIADAAHDWEPANRDGWDVDVAGCKAEAEGLLPAVFGYELGQRDIDLLLWLHAEAKHLNDWHLRIGQLQQRWIDEATDERDAARREAAAERSSRQAWADEVLRLEDVLEQRRRQMALALNAHRMSSWGELAETGTKVAEAWLDGIAAQIDAEERAKRVEPPTGVCACLTDEHADQLANAGFARPVCAVHPENGGAA